MKPLGTQCCHILEILLIPTRIAIMHRPYSAAMSLAIILLVISQFLLSSEKTPNQIDVLCEYLHILKRYLPIGSKTC